MDRNGKGRHFHQQALAFASAVLLGTPASPALAAPETSAKLVRCGSQSCLRIAGRRDDPTFTVSVNGHVVPVEGERHWKTQLPVEVVREWSAANARTIEVSLGTPERQREITHVDLPIGLLADTATLAALVISVR